MRKFLLVFFLLSTTFFSSHSVVRAGEMETYGILDVKNHDIPNLPHAVGDGIADDTEALNRLTRYAFMNRYSVLFPEGTYRVTDQIEMVNDQRVSSGNRQGFHLIGSTKGARPTIMLDANSAGFGNRNNPKPVINLWRLCDVENNEPCSDRGTFDNSANFFNSGMRNLNIVIKPGNPGAVAIHHNAAQRNFQEDVSIVMESGFAGYTAIPGFGSSVMSGVSITGGDYGFYLEGELANRPTLTDITLINQNIAAIYADPRTDLVFAGFDITKQNTPVIEVKYGGVYGNGIVMTDGVIKVSGGSQPAIKNDNKANITLYNVDFRNTQKIVQYGTETAIAGNQSGWTKIEEYYALSSHSGAYSVINGNSNSSNKEIVQKRASSEPSIDPRLYHAIGRSQLSPDHMVALSTQAGSGVCNALNPNDSYDIRDSLNFNSKAGLQEMINDANCSIIFLPRGDYYLGSTLTLGENTQLVGLGIPFTFLTPVRRSNGFSQSMSASGWLPTSNVDFITTVNSANATTWMSDIRIATPTDPEQYDWFTSINWKAGRYSTIKTVDIKALGNRTKGTNPKSDFVVSGNGGGKFFGASSFGIRESANVHPNARRFSVLNTSEPLSIYNFNLEDGTGAHQGEFVGAKNVSIYGMKFEDHDPIYLSDAENIAIFGGTKFKEQVYRNSSGVLVASVNGHTAGGNKITEVIGGNTTVYGVNTNLAVYKRGTVNRILVPADGTPVPTLSPTSSEPTLTPTPTSSEPTLSPTPVAIIGDFDESGCVNIFDFSLLMASFNMGPDDEGYNPIVNLDSNPVINILDFSIFISHFNEGC